MRADLPHPAKGRERSLGYEVTISAPVEAVWKALTDAMELARWFPLEASVRPGVGGSVRLSWGRNTKPQR